MCVYKFTLDTGFYYIGATSNLCDRITTHMVKYRSGGLASLLKQALSVASVINFEVLRFANNTKDLGKWEEYFLKKNVGLPLCLNIQDFITASYRRGESLFKVAKVGKDGLIIETYNTPAEAAFKNKIAVSTLLNNCLAKYPNTNMFFRRLNSDGSIKVPAHPMRENKSGKKPVKQFDKEMNFIAYYASVSDAARAIGVDRKRVSDLLRGLGKHVKGYTFRNISENGEVLRLGVCKRKTRKKKEKEKEKTFVIVPKKSVFVFNDVGEKIEEYSSIYMTAIKRGIDRSALAKALRRTGFYKGFTYKYA